MLNGNEKIIKHKTGLLNLAQELGNVSKACQIMGMSRDTFYRYKAAVEDGGIEALMDKNRRKPILKIALMKPPSSGSCSIPWTSRLMGSCAAVMN